MTSTHSNSQVPTKYGDFTYNPPEEIVLIEIALLVFVLFSSERRERLQVRHQALPTFFLEAPLLATPGRVQVVEDPVHDRVGLFLIWPA
jgi:hypothetical protein